MKEHSYSIQSIEPTYINQEKHILQFLPINSQQTSLIIQIEFHKSVQISMPNKILTDI